MTMTISVTGSTIASDNVIVLLRCVVDAIGCTSIVFVLSITVVAIVTTATVSKQKEKQLLLYWSTIMFLIPYTWNCCGN